MMQPFHNDTFMYPSPSGVPDIPEPSRTFPMITPESFPNSETRLSLYESYSPDHSGSPRDILDPIRDSEQYSVSFSSFHNNSKQRRILKCVSLQFVNYADMIETLLRSITNRGIWKFIWLPHTSTITLRSNEPLTYDTNFLLSHDSLLIRGYDRRYLCIPSSTSLPISILLSFPWYVIPCEPVTCLHANWMTFHREGPEYIYPSYGWTNPTLDPCASTNTFRTLNATFIATQLRCGV